MQVDLNNVEYNSRAIATHLPLVQDPVTSYWVLGPEFLGTNEIMYGKMHLVPFSLHVIGTSYDRPTAYIHGFTGDKPYYLHFYKFTEAVKMPIKQIAVNRYWHIFFEGIILTNDTDYEIYNVLDATDQKKILELCYPDGHPQEYTPYQIHNSTVGRVGVPVGSGQDGSVTTS